MITCGRGGLIAPAARTHHVSAAQFRTALADSTAAPGGVSGDRCPTVPRPAVSILSTRLDRKSTRLNSSHVAISYAVFCLKKKKTHKIHHKVKKIRERSMLY